MTHYAIMTDEVLEVYSAPQRIWGAINASISPEVNSETLYADDQADTVATSLGAVEVELNVKDLPKSVHAALLGASIDSNGVLVDNKNDNAPYVALGFRSKKANGQYRYVWLYKGKFSPAEEEFATKEDSPTFQTPTISATFLPRQTDGQWRARVDSDDADVPAAVITNWFNAVYTSAVDVAAPTVTIVPANNATAVAVGANIVWTFNEVIRPSDVTQANFIVQKADGTAQVAGSLVLDATMKIVTFDPTATLTAATQYMAIATVGVRDKAGNALVAPSVTKFTTA